MSDPTYRIDVTHDPHSELLAWDATVTRLSDGQIVRMLHAATMQQAMEDAREAVRLETHARQEGVSVEVDDDGMPVDEPAAAR
jgi:hypothetical protein